MSQAVTRARGGGSGPGDRGEEGRRASGCRFKRRSEQEAQNCSSGAEDRRRGRASDAGLAAARGRAQGSGRAAPRASPG